MVIFKATLVVEPLVASNILTLESWWSMRYFMLVFSIVSVKRYITVLAFKFVAWVVTYDVSIYCSLVLAHLVYLPKSLYNHALSVIVGVQSS